MALMLIHLSGCRSDRKTPGTDLFDRENLVAWCIVPFDAMERTPEQRAEMLNELGIPGLAYDYREQHLASFEKEIRTLEEHGIDVRHLIVNHVIADATCDFLRRRREMQQPYIQMLEDEYGDTVDLVKVPLLPYEVKGIDRLREVEEQLFQ